MSSVIKVIEFSSLQMRAFIFLLNMKSFSGSGRSESILPSEFDVIGYVIEPQGLDKNNYSVIKYIIEI